MSLVKEAWQLLQLVTPALTASAPHARTAAFECHILQEGNDACGINCTQDGLT